MDLVEYNIQKDKGKRDEMMEKTGGSKGVPVFDIEGIIVRGFNQDTMKDTIEKRRSI